MSERPKALSVFLASEWLSHVSSSPAWDEMNDLVDSKPDAAWRVVRAMVAYAPDYGVLAAIAAGPVESLIDRDKEAFLPLYRLEAERDARFRACLRAAYTDWPSDFGDLLERDATASTSLQDANLREVDVNPDEMALLISWFHHATTGWASSLLDELTSQDPAAAWDALRLLLIFAEEDTSVREQIFDDALQPFIRKNFDAHRAPLATAAKRHPSLQEWFLGLKRAPIEDSNAWASFCTELATA